jgi:DNA-binding winged helix-turn-helix (wHTH) protein/TolB-like protein/Tfp pilus assembly protein PilF
MAINSDANTENDRRRFENFELDPGRRQLSRNGQPLPLNAKAFDLLVFLTDNPGRTVSKEEILDSIWKDQFVEESNLAVQVSAIRKALGDSASEPRFLATIPGTGYQFIAEISKSSLAASEKDLADADAPPVSIPDRRKISLPAMLVLLFVAIVAAVFAWSYLGGRDAEIRSIAVLPFEQKGADPEFLGDGLAESVIFSLSRLPDLKVLASGSSFRYRTEKPDAVSIGRDLGVQAILSGRVVQSGDTVSVTAQLVSTADNSVLWGDQLSRKLSDIDQLQNDIAQAITGKLRKKLTGAEAKTIGSSQTENSEAYTLYLIGRHHMNRLTDDGFMKGRDSFMQAIEKDPNYALAHAALADSYNMLCGWGSIAPDECFPLARAAALRSLEIDGALAEGHAALGLVKMSYDFDWSGAEADLKRAVELNPNLLNPHQYLSLLYVVQNRFDEAGASIGRARELDPLSILNIIMLGNVSYFQRQPDRAIEAYRQAIDMDANSGLGRWSLGNAYLLANRLDDAIAEYRKAVVLSGDSPDERISLAYAHAVRGNTDEARKIVQELNDRGSHVPPSLIASIHGVLGERDKAFELLEEAVRRKDSTLLFLAVDPMFDPLRSDTRFPILLKRLGF